MSSSLNSFSSGAQINPNGEHTLLARVRRGDREAYAALVAPYRDRVYATAMRLLGNSHDAAEVTQEALLRAFWKLTGFHGRAHFYTWLYRIALNLCYQRLSAKRHYAQPGATASSDPGVKLPSVEDVADTITGLATSPREAAERHEAEVLVRQALGSLTSADFQLLILREFEELSYEELARRYRVPKGTIMSRLHRARLALAGRLHKLGITS